MGRFFQRKKSRIIIGTLLFVIGLGLILYPWVDRYFQRQQQLQLLTQWELVQQEQKPRTSPSTNNSLAPSRSLTAASETELLIEEGEEQNQFELMQQSFNLHGQTMLGVITIDKIDVREPMVQGATEQSLNLGVGTVVDERHPGEVGNFVLAGHRGWSYGYQFNRLDELVDGDEITITTANGNYTYEVTSTFIVTPDDLSVLDDNEDNAEITLITCEPMYRSTHRLIVKAEIKQEP